LEVEVVLDVKKIIFINVFTHELIGKGTVEFEIGLFCGKPELRIEGQGIE